MEDSAIIELFFARSESAIAELERKYGALMRSVAIGVLANREDAAECVNDACLSAWNAIPPARPENLAAWICRVARNGAVSMLRKRSAQRRGGEFDAALDELADTLAAPGGVEDALSARELAGHISAFLDTLSAENRYIFLRRHWFSDASAEIARRTGLSESRVNLRLTRMRKALRKYLEEREAYA